MDNTTIDRSFQQMYGQFCWGIRFERLLNLTMSFGDPLLRIQEPYRTKARSKRVRMFAEQRHVTVKGQWWLWIYLCHWQIIDGDNRLATGASSLRDIGEAIRRLDGQRLVSANVAPITGLTHFNFDLGCTLECRRRRITSREELWTLYRPNGFVLSVHSDGTYCHHRASQAPQQHQHRAIH